MFPVRGRKLQKHVTNQSLWHIGGSGILPCTKISHLCYVIRLPHLKRELLDEHFIEWYACIHPQAFVRFNLFIKCKSNSLQVRLFKILWKWVLFYKDVKAKLFDTVVWTVTLSKGGWRVLEGGRVGGEAHCERFFETILYGIPWFS